MSLTPPTDQPPPALFAPPPAAQTGAKPAPGARPAPGATPEPGESDGAAEPGVAVKRGRAENQVATRRPGPVEEAGRQLSLFGVAAVEPSPDDLAGLLAGPGEVVRMGGTARVSVVVEDAWRVHVLVAELRQRGLNASWEHAVERRLGVRTAYATTLAPLARRWLRGTVKRPPDGFHLDGPRLRLWVAAAGSPDPQGFALRLGAADRECWASVGAALAAVGLPAELVDAAAGGPAYRIVGRRPVARLAELVGERPAAAPPDRWPGGV